MEGRARPCMRGSVCPRHFGRGSRNSFYNLSNPWVGNCFGVTAIGIASYAALRPKIRIPDLLFGDISFRDANNSLGNSNTHGTIYSNLCFD